MTQDAGTLIFNPSTACPNPLPPDMWGSYGADRPASQWVQYDWAEPTWVNLEGKSNLWE